jgi:gluconolactonase
MSPLTEPDSLEELFIGTLWGEGPVWIPERGHLLWSDVAGNLIRRYDPASGTVSVFRENSGGINGQTLTADGRLIQCSQDGRHVEVELADGVLLIDSWNGARFNSPNDVIVSSDGAIWFTDPPYGILARGGDAVLDSDYGASWVFRVDPETGAVAPVVTDMEHPNGLALSPDESVLYVADSSRLAGVNGHHHIKAYPVVGDRCGEGSVIATIPSGVPDGIRVDSGGRIWSSSDGGVLVFAPDGALLERFPVPGTVTNLCFGSEGWLYVTSSRGLYRIRTAANGARQKETGR